MPRARPSTARDSSQPAPRHHRLLTADMRPSITHGRPGEVIALIADRAIASLDERPGRHPAGQEQRVAAARLALSACRRRGRLESQDAYRR